MKRMIVIGLLAMTASAIAGGQAKNRNAATNGKAEREIRQTEDKLRQALLRSDIPTLDLIFADEYIVTNQFGQVQTKPQMISALKTGALKFESIGEDDMTVRVYQNTAVVTGRTTSKHEGRETMQARFTRVYVKRQGRWQAVAYQVTRIA